MDTVFFQAIGDAVPRKESGCLGNPRGPVDPKSEVVIKRKANPETMKKITNFFLEMFICPNYTTFFFFRKLRGLDTALPRRCATPKP